MALRRKKVVVAKADKLTQAKTPVVSQPAERVDVNLNTVSPKGNIKSQYNQGASIADLAEVHKLTTDEVVVKLDLESN